MSLITPDFGLLFWMTLIFAIVFFILAKFGFPLITDMVAKRQERIDRSIADAREIEARMKTLAAEQEAALAEAQRQRAEMLREASETRSKILSEAKAEARAEADKILSEAKVQIAAEKESALRDIRKEVALVSVNVAEKVLRHELSDESAQRSYLDALVDEASQAPLQS